DKKRQGRSLELERFQFASSAHFVQSLEISPKTQAERGIILRITCPLYHSRVVMLMRINHVLSIYCLILALTGMGCVAGARTQQTVSTNHRSQPARLSIANTSRLSTQSADSQQSKQGNASKSESLIKHAGFEPNHTGSEA